MRSLLLTAAVVAATTPTLAQPVLDLATSFELPDGAFDLLPDGRLLAIDANGSVLQQDGIHGETYSVAGAIGPVNAAGFSPSFVAISPDGQTVAVGNNEFNAANAVSIFAAAELTGPGTPTPTATITTPNFKADWADNSTLFVSGADSSTFTPTVNRLDITAATAETVISPAGVFSGGLAVHGTTLLVGDGDSGDVRAFDTANFPAFPVSFLAGDLVASSTSASSIDTLGDLLLVAGAAFGGQGNATVFDRATGLSTTLAPAGPDAFYGGYFNHATNQLVVTANGTGFVYDIIPAPATLALAPAALLAARRRRA